KCAEPGSQAPGVRDPAVNKIECIVLGETLTPSGLLQAWPFSRSGRLRRITELRAVFCSRRQHDQLVLTREEFGMLSDCDFPDMAQSPTSLRVVPRGVHEVVE